MRGECRVYSIPVSALSVSGYRVCSQPGNRQAPLESGCKGNKNISKATYSFTKINTDISRSSAKPVLRYGLSFLKDTAILSRA